jgi:hypothetical protein
VPLTFELRLFLKESQAMRDVFKWGGLVGAATYLLGTVGLTLLGRVLFPGQPVDVNHPGVLTLSCLGIFGLLFAFSAAGYFAGRDTLQDGYGAVAGMVALAVYYVLSLLYTPGAKFAAALSAGGAAPGKSAVEGAFARAVAFVSAALIVFGIAALMGWLGGRPGANNARRRLGAGIHSQD